MTNKLLNAKLFNNIREKLVVRQEVQKAYYDRTAHPLSELKPKENVRILNFKDKTWGPAQVVSKDQNFPRSYIVKDEAGKILRRNRKHIRKSNTFFKEQSDPYGYFDDAFQSPNVGNLGFGNLKNYGIGRVVVRHKKQFPEACYYIVRKVVPLRETIGPGPDELVYGNVWAEEVFRGRRCRRRPRTGSSSPGTPPTSTHNRKWRSKCSPGRPPVLSLLAAQKGAPPSMPLVYDYPRDWYRQKFELPPHHDYKVAGEGEEPNYRLKVNIPEKFKADIKS
ncbi:hypothetical protein JTE90_021999 [Oedothorax gibbosus]|uniref:Uncharacterized protein n=1 Tax=Oedothorax gibbosus TaxID=931172 RepID=A0AAV6TS27_9ARAC|nr:hypothetical protein JTE90_021999 [Oedothorax gibbosus]